MKYASVYSRPRSPFWYISFPDPITGSRKHKATDHRISDPSGKRRAYDEAVQLAKEAKVRMPSGAKESWGQWVLGWLRLHYNGKTLVRYETAWSHVQEFLEEKRIKVPRTVRYEHASQYLLWRTAQKRHRGTQINYNTALTELKVLGVILKEAVRLGYTDANPIAQLGLGRKDVKEKPEITPAELQIIVTALATRAQWMQDCFTVAIHQGCRLTETAVPLNQINLVKGTITFRGKGNKVFTTRLHESLRSLVLRRTVEGARALCDLPPMPAKAWHSFFNEIGLGHLSFHCTRVTVITQLARSGIPQGMAQSYVGHASETVHRVYQRLTVADLSQAVSAIPAMPGIPGGPTPTVPDGLVLYRIRRQKESPVPA